MYDDIRAQYKELGFRIQKAQRDRGVFRRLGMFGAYMRAEIRIEELFRMRESMRNQFGKRVCEGNRPSHTRALPDHLSYINRKAL